MLESINKYYDQKPETYRQGKFKTRWELCQSRPTQEKKSVILDDIVKLEEFEISSRVYSFLINAIEVRNED